MPLAAPSCSPSAMTLERQSTTVPKTSKVRIFMLSDLNSMDPSRRGNNFFSFEQIANARFRNLSYISEGEPERNDDFSHGNPHDDRRMAPPTQRSPAHKTEQDAAKRGRPRRLEPEHFGIHERRSEKP